MAFVRLSWNHFKSIRQETPSRWWFAHLVYFPLLLEEMDPIDDWFSFGWLDFQLKRPVNLHRVAHSKFQSPKIAVWLDMFLESVQLGFRNAIRMEHMQRISWVFLDIRFLCRPSGVKTTFGLPGIITTTGVVGGVAMGCYGVNKAEVFN